LADNKANRRLIISDRSGVWHSTYRRKTTCRSGTRAGAYCLNVFAPWFAQVAMHVDESRRHNLLSTVDYLCAIGGVDIAADRGHFAIHEQNVGDSIMLLGRVQYTAVSK
jgi:hypothetical protein